MVRIGIEFSRVKESWEFIYFTWFSLSTKKKNERRKITGEEKIDFVSYILK